MPFDYEQERENRKTNRGIQRNNGSPMGQGQPQSPKRKNREVQEAVAGPYAEQFVDKSQTAQNIDQYVNPDIRLQPRDFSFQREHLNQTMQQPQMAQQNRPTLGNPLSTETFQYGQNPNNQFRSDVFSGLGFDLQRPQNPAKSAKDAVLQGAQSGADSFKQAAMDKSDDGSLEQWLRQFVQPNLEANGYEVLDAIGDQMYIRSHDGEGWNDLVSNAGAANADLAFQPQTPGQQAQQAGMPMLGMMGNNIYDMVQQSILGPQQQPMDNSGSEEELNALMELLAVLQNGNGSEVLF